MRIKKKQEEKDAMEPGRRKKDEGVRLPGGVTYVDRQREATVASETDIKKELKVSTDVGHLFCNLVLICAWVYRVTRQVCDKVWLT